MLIAYCVLHQPRYGQVTAFARKYGVSRQTIYAIKASFKDAVVVVEPSYTDRQLSVKQLILSLRMENERSPNQRSLTLCSSGTNTPTAAPNK